MSITAFSVALVFEDDTIPSCELTTFTARPFTFADVFRYIRCHVDEDFNMECVVFYDRDYRHIEFGMDEQDVEHDFVRIMIINKNLLRFYHSGERRSAIATWPWVMTEEDENWIAQDCARRQARQQAQ